LTGVMVAYAAPIVSPPADTAQRTPPAGATYVGSTTCFTCHSAEHRNWSGTLHSKMIQDAAANPKAVLADFSKDDDKRQAEIGGQKRAYAAADIAYTIGNKDRQRYILKTDKGYQVLPGQWNIADKAWVAADAADWLKDCAGCHTTGFDVKQMAFNETSVGCEACHGPGSVHVDKAKALPKDTQPNSDTVYELRQSIVKTVDSTVCGQCHSRGMSADGEHAYPVGYVVGGPLDKTMFVPVAPTGKEDDPYFWPDGHEKNYGLQYAAYMASGHGSKTLDLIKTSDHGADYCLPCHSTDYAKQDTIFAQDKVTKDNAMFNITCVQCHAPHGEGQKADQLVSESYDLCVSCHTGTSGGASPLVVGGDAHHPMREMFEGISFLGLKANPSPHFANEAHGPVCASCHMPTTGKSEGVGALPSHAFKIIRPTEAAKGEADSCTGCHSLERDPKNTAENVTAKITAVQTDTKKRVETLKTDLDTTVKAHPEWDPKATDKPEAQVKADRIHTLISFIEADGSWGFHNPGYTDQILKEAEKLMDDIYQ
jgi:predicted CXXCH cytochrome family protein